LLAVIMFLDCVGTLFFSPSLVAPQTNRGAMRAESLTSEMRDYLTATKVIAVIQHCALAAAILIALSAVFDGTAASGNGPTATAKTDRGRHPSEESQRAPPPRLPENACLSCRQPIPLDADKCPVCGWSWGSEDAASG
jgi:hypothetical protein